jgi:hypothetical protein
VAHTQVHGSAAFLRHTATTPGPCHWGAAILSWRQSPTVDQAGCALHMDSKPVFVNTANLLAAVDAARHACVTSPHVDCMHAAAEAARPTCALPGHPQPVATPAGAASPAASSLSSMSRSSPWYQLPRPCVCRCCGRCAPPVASSRQRCHRVRTQLWTPFAADAATCKRGSRELTM